MVDYLFFDKDMGTREKLNWELLLEKVILQAP